MDVQEEPTFDDIITKAYKSIASEALRLSDDIRNSLPYDGTTPSKMDDFNSFLESVAEADEIGYGAIQSPCDEQDFINIFQCLIPEYSGVEEDKDYEEMKADIITRDIIDAVNHYYGFRGYEELKTALEIDECQRYRGPLTGATIGCIRDSDDKISTVLNIYINPEEPVESILYGAGSIHKQLLPEFLEIRNFEKGFYDIPELKSRFKDVELVKSEDDLKFDVFVDDENLPISENDMEVLNNCYEKYMARVAFIAYYCLGESIFRQKDIIDYYREQTDDPLSNKCYSMIAILNTLSPLLSEEPNMMIPIVGICAYMDSDKGFAERIMKSYELQKCFVEYALP